MRKLLCVLLLLASAAPLALAQVNKPILRWREIDGVAYYQPGGGPLKPALPASLSAAVNAKASLMGGNALSGNQTVAGSVSASALVATGAYPLGYTVTAATYAEALSKCGGLPPGASAAVKVLADESSANAGTGSDGANPTTYYDYWPGLGLRQKIYYPLN